MKFFKDDQDEVYAYEDQQVLEGLADGLTPITEDEKKQLLVPTVEQLTAQKKAEIQARLNEIDLESLRPIRAIQQANATDQDTQKLAALDAEAVQLRAELAGL